MGLMQEFQQADIAVKRLGDLMDAPPEPYSPIPTRANTPSPFKGEGWGEGNNGGDSNNETNGKDIRYLSANELRNTFGVVPQETLLISGSIYDNLTLANPHASFEQIIQACQLVCNGLIKCDTS
ncbi:hypothetical protein [Methylotenera sp.]|uniref:hypothetical protein n=1 Tax=Methylotenera sp. TaxID=2051956 RepID=UPI00248A35EF|nr:hypothetical protein [Methylotenera sp.]MDI1300214.1 hypothetical protein [Methylotenera sp.]